MRILHGAKAQSVAARSLIVFLFSRCARHVVSRKTDSVSGEVHGNFVACLFQAGVRALNRDPSSLAVTAAAARAMVPALHDENKSRTECVGCAQVSPVVKEKRYFAPNDATEQGREPCRGADLRQRRDPQGSGGVVPKHRVAAANRPRVDVSSRTFPGEF